MEADWKDGFGSLFCKNKKSYCSMLLLEPMVADSHSQAPNSDLAIFSSADSAAIAKSGQTYLEVYYIFLYNADISYNY